jgi:hypothetical protein
MIPAECGFGSYVGNSLIDELSAEQLMFSRGCVETKAAQILFACW